MRDEARWMWMWMYVGGTLEERIRACKGSGVMIDETQVVAWLAHIALAMRYFHSKHILHRDLKTANLFLTANDVIMVGDFGIAAQLDHTLDMKHTCVGSPYYMSPEVGLSSD